MGKWTRKIADSAINFLLAALWAALAGAVVTISAAIYFIVQNEDSAWLDRSFGALVALFVVLVGGLVASAFQRRREGYGPQAEETSADDLNEPFISNRTVKLIDLIAGSHDNTVRDRTFEDCVIVGPVVVTPKGISFEGGSSFDNSSDEMLWEFPDERLRKSGAIHVKDCHFRRCRFRDVGFSVTGDRVAQMRDHIDEARGEA